MSITNELKDQYQNLIKDNLTTYEIAKHLNVSASTVKRHLRELGVRTLRYKKLIGVIEEIKLKEMIDKNLSRYEIAKELNCSAGRIVHWMKKYGLNTVSAKIEKNCIKCNKEIQGLKRRFCSTKCNRNYTNSWFNSSVRQKKKGIDKKIKLIKLLGELKCSKCGYEKNLSCLSFHHKDPSQKKFPLDQRSCSAFSFKRLVEEALKCQILCLNCHAAHHNPQHEIGGLSGN